MIATAYTVLFVFCTLKIAVFTKQKSELVYLQIIFYI